jgi:hypothetical protein
MMVRNRHNDWITTAWRIGDNRVAVDVVWFKNPLVSIAAHDDLVFNRRLRNDCIERLEVSASSRCGFNLFRECVAKIEADKVGTVSTFSVVGHRSSPFIQQTQRLAALRLIDMKPCTSRSQASHLLCGDIYLRGWRCVVPYKTFQPHGQGLVSFFFDHPLTSMISFDSHCLKVYQTVATP